MNTVFLHLLPDGLHALAWTPGAADTAAVSPLVAEPLAVIAARYPGAAAVVFMPSADVLFTIVAATARQLRQAGNNLAWLIEEQCAEDAENLHVLAGPTMGEDQTPLLAISREYLQDLLARLRGAGLAVLAVVPDLFLLPAAEAGWCLAETADGRCLLRTGEFSGAVMESAMLPLMLSAAKAEQGASPVKVFATLNEPAQQSRLQAWAAAEAVTLEWQAQAFAANGAGSAAALVADWSLHPANLLQGEFASTPQWQLPAALRMAALFLAAAFALQLLSEWVHYGFYRYQANKTAEAAVALYKASHPEARLRSAKPVDEVKKRFATEKNQREQGRSALEALTQVAEFLQGSGLVTQRVDYSAGVLTLDVDARALAELEALRARLSQAGLACELLSANAQGGLVRGRFRVEG